MDWIVIFDVEINGVLVKDAELHIRGVSQVAETVAWLEKNGAHNVSFCLEKELENDD